MADTEANVSRIWCGPDDPPRGEKSQYKQYLNSLPPSANVYLKAWNIADGLDLELSAISLDLLEIAAYVYSTDQSTARGGNTFPKDGRNWYRQFELSIPVRKPEIWSEPQVAEKLVELLRFMADDDYQFVFRQLKGDWPREMYLEFEVGRTWFKPDSILLFSGGLDSLTGVVEELQDADRQIILVSHCSVGKISKPQEDLVAELKNSYDARDRLLHIPVWVNKEKGITKDANQRSRSFLYASIAAVIASMTDTREIKFYENGIVSSNLPISNQVIGARASRSTHPKTLRLMSELFSTIFGHDFKVINPFFCKTKSDVLATLKANNGQKLVSMSRSCTRTMSSTRIHTHCGTCSQCIERRLAVLHNHLEDFDPEEAYKTPLFLGALKGKEDRMMGENYIQHAGLLEEIGIDNFYERFPDGLSLVQEIDLPVNEAAGLLYDLHHRHGKQAARVINTQIERHSNCIRKGQTPPNSLLEMIVNRPGSGKRAAGATKFFPMPDSTCWKDIHIEIVARDSLIVRAGKITKQYHGFDMGFRDLRKIDRFNKQWELLEDFAENRGTLNWQSPSARRSLQKRIEALNRLLRYFFRLQDNPIAPYKKNVGWVAKFQISDSSYGKS